MLRPFTVAAVSLLLCSTTACVVIDKKSGDGDNVRIHTPVGGLDVHTNSVSPAEIGLPIYPCATLAAMRHNKQSSADVQMSFAGWQLHVRVLNYQSTDPRDRIEAFYQRALEQYGDVITCQNNKVIGNPVKTKQGLTCNNDYNYNINLSAAPQKNGGAAAETTAISSSANLELRAGSPSNQHLVVLDASTGAGTTFELLNVLAPHGHETD